MNHERIVERLVEAAVKDKDLMQDTGGKTKGRDREPHKKPPRDDVKRRYRPRRKTKDQRDKDVDLDPDLTQGKRKSSIEDDVRSIRVFVKKRFPDWVFQVRRSPKGRIFVKVKRPEGVSARDFETGWERTTWEGDPYAQTLEQFLDGLEREFEFYLRKVWKVASSRTASDPADLQPIMQALQGAVPFLCMGPRSYSDDVKGHLIHIITEERHISEKAFAAYDEVMAEVDKLWVDEAVAIGEIVSRFEANGDRSQFCAECIYSKLQDVED